MVPISPLPIRVADIIHLPSNYEPSTVNDGWATFEHLLHYFQGRENETISVPPTPELMFDLPPDPDFQPSAPVEAPLPLDEGTSSSPSPPPPPPVLTPAILPSPTLPVPTNLTITGANPPPSELPNEVCQFLDSVAGHEARAIADLRGTPTSFYHIRLMSRIIDRVRGRYFTQPRVTRTMVTTSSGTQIQLKKDHFVLWANIYGLPITPGTLKNLAVAWGGMAVDMLTTLERQEQESAANGQPHDMLLSEKIQLIKWLIDAVIIEETPTMTALQRRALQMSIASWMRLIKQGIL